MRPPTFALGSRTIGEGQPCFVLAEVASAHAGSADRALRMLEAAFKMGADGIKFQLFRAELLVVRRHPGRKDFDQIELSPKEWKKAQTRTRSIPRTWRIRTSSAGWGRSAARSFSPPAASPKTPCVKRWTSW